jgi:hypothetical protein
MASRWIAAKRNESAICAAHSRAFKSTALKVRASLGLYNLLNKFRSFSPSALAANIRMSYGVLPWEKFFFTARSKVLGSFILFTSLAPKSCVGRPRDILTTSYFSYPLL